MNITMAQLHQNVSVGHSVAARVRQARRSTVAGESVPGGNLLGVATQAFAIAWGMGHIRGEATAHPVCWLTGR